jgi:hypothetical protein
MNEKLLALMGSCPPVADSLPASTQHLQFAFFIPQQAGEARASAWL